jgi:vacuolar-type H+-ATPase subunit H
MRETIHRVLAAEDEAKRLVETAREEGEAHLADCRRQAESLAADAGREVRLASAALLEAAAVEARREREELIRQASVEIAGTLRLDEVLARQAVDAIVQCVCGRGRS